MDVRWTSSVYWELFQPGDQQFPTYLSFNFDELEQNNFLNQPICWPTRATEVVWIAILADLAKTSYLKDHRTYEGD